MIEGKGKPRRKLKEGIGNCEDKRIVTEGKRGKTGEVMMGKEGIKVST